MVIASNLYDEYDEGLIDFMERMQKNMQHFQDGFISLLALFQEEMEKRPTYTQF